MIHTTKMTQKGQITIPKHIRDRFHDKTGGNFLVSYDDEHKEVRIKPLLTLEELAGSLKSDITLTDEQLRTARSQFGRRWAQG